MKLNALLFGVIRHFVVHFISKSRCGIQYREILSKYCGWWMYDDWNKRDWLTKHELIHLKPHNWTISHHLHMSDILLGNRCSLWLFHSHFVVYAWNTFNSIVVLPFLTRKETIFASNFIFESIFGILQKGDFFCFGNLKFFIVYPKESKSIWHDTAQLPKQVYRRHLSNTSWSSFKERNDSLPISYR